MVHIFSLFIFIFFIQCNVNIIFIPVLFDELNSLLKMIKNFYYFYYFS